MAKKCANDILKIHTSIIIQEINGLDTIIEKLERAGVAIYSLFPDAPVLKTINAALSHAKCNRHNMIERTGLNEKGWIGCEQSSSQKPLKKRPTKKISSKRSTISKPA